VAADAGQPAQVFLNLLVNAAEAIPPGRAEEHRVTVRARCEAEQVVVEVADSGAGIDPDHLSRVFDPFFTTKPFGHGAGLGLSVSHSIVSRFGGNMSVKSEVGAGTTFSVSLPRASSDADAPKAAAAARRGRILVLDDEPLVLKSITRALKPWDVVGSTSPRDALARIARGERFDLVLCDVMMPDVTGPELYRQACAVAPWLAGRFVFLTGGAFGAGARDLDSTGCKTLEKPFDAAALARFVAEEVAGMSERGP
jgi:CheY-like chemotaxis protein